MVNIKDSIGMFGTSWNLGLCEAFKRKLKMCVTLFGQRYLNDCFLGAVSSKETNIKCISVQRMKISYFRVYVFDGTVIFTC